MLLIGSHVSFSNDEQLLGSVKQALSYGSNTFMFYTGAPTNTKRSKIDLNLVNEAKKLMQESNIDINNVVVHAPYIINLANRSDEQKYQFSINFLKQEIGRCQTLGINKLVLHPGSSVNTTPQDGIQNIIEGLNEVLANKPNIKILLETMAGKGSELGRNLQQLQTIIEHIDNQECMGICLDTCHLNDAGYDMQNFEEFLHEFDLKIGIDKIGCIHINDSKNLISSHKDRHQNIGLGTLGYDTLLNIIYHPLLESIPKILETPYIDKDENNKRTYAPYKFEIQMIRSRSFNESLIEDIKKYYS